MTQRRKELYYGLILIQGTLSKTHCPHDAFAGKRFFVLRLDVRLDHLFGNFTRLRLFSHACWSEEFTRASRYNSANALFCSTVLPNIPWTCESRYQETSFCAFS